MKLLHPFPIYEAQFSNGARLRMSFASPADKPVDFAAGRRAVEEIYFNDSGNERGRTWYRGTDGAWRAAWPKRNAGVTITAGFVEHHSIGRVEDTPANRVPIVVKRPSWKVLAAAARKALEAGNAAQALALLQEEAA